MNIQTITQSKHRKDFKMKKALIATLALALIAGIVTTRTVMARTELTIVIPTQYEQRVLDAIQAMGGAKFQLVSTSTTRSRF